MRRTTAVLLAALLCMALMGGCALLRLPEPGTTQSGTSGGGDPQPEQADPIWQGIPFAEGQLYAVAHLGYQQPELLDAYCEAYLGGAELPVHYLSDGDFYLIVPRYEGMELALYENDMETMGSSLRYQDPECGAFVLQCNVSDIFPDATVQLTWQGEQAEFSPFLSLKDGALDVGEHGLVLTLPQQG